LEDKHPFTCRQQTLKFLNEKSLGQTLFIERNGVQASLGITLKQKLIDGSLSLNFQTNEKATISCPICGHSIEDVVHFLIKCVGYRSAREVLFQKIAKLVPSGLFEEFSMLKSAAKASALISNVFWGVYSAEIDILVQGFLENIWKIRDCISKLIFQGTSSILPII